MLVAAAAVLRDRTAVGTVGTYGSTHTVEIAIVNSGFGGTRLGRGVGGAIPRERVRRLAAGRRSVRRRVLVEAWL